MKINVTVTRTESDKAYDKAFKHLYTKRKGDLYEPWFSTKKEADNWAGDVLYDVIHDILAELGIQEEEEE